MRLHKANYSHLYLAGFDLAESDREEMDRMLPGRDPIDVLTASSGDRTTHAITDMLGRVLAVGGHEGGIIWFVHTRTAERLSVGDKRRMFWLLAAHLLRIKRQAIRQRPQDHFHFTNIVSRLNWKHRKLLKALGAEFDGVIQQVNGHEFLQFYI